MEKTPSLVNKFPREMFVTSYCHFRRIMESTKYTLDQKDEAFGSLCQDYIRCKLDDNDIKAFVALEREWSMRRIWEELSVSVTYY